MNLKDIFQDLNPCKFLVYLCLLIFFLLFCLRLDSSITWSYWVIFLPLWIWKLFVLLGATVGSIIWWKNPQYRFEGDGYVQYKAMLICTGLNLLMLMFELLVCDKLANPRDYNYWTLLFIPLQVLSIVSVGICVWAVKHERTFEMELFCAVNILQFTFVALRLDKFIQWSWVIVLIPLWMLLCVALIGVLYAIILAILLLRSNDILAQQRRGNIYSAVGYTFIVILTLIFFVVLSNKLDQVYSGENSIPFSVVGIPLFMALSILLLMSFIAKGGNHWWFGLRKDFSQFLCGLLQEYGNISYKMESHTNQTNRDSPTSQRRKSQSKVQKVTVPIINIDAPD